MKIEIVAKKPRSISEVSGKNPGSFAGFIRKKEASLKEMEISARKKALLARQPSLSWAS